MMPSPTAPSGSFGYVFLGTQECLTSCASLFCLFLLLTADDELLSDIEKLLGQSILRQEGAKENVCYISVHFLAATEAQALMCSIFRSSNPSNNCDMSGIYHGYVFLKGNNVKSSLPSRLASLEKGTLCHTKSLVPYVPPPLSWWQQLRCVAKVSCWITGTEAFK